MGLQSESSTKPVDFLKSSVRTLFINYKVDPTHILPILQACSSITSFATYIPETCVSSELAALMVESNGLSCIRKLAIPGCILPSGQRNFTHSIFHAVSHLEIIWEMEEDWTWDALVGLQNLTHLSVDLQFESRETTVVDLVRRLLLHCPIGLRVLLVSLIPEDLGDDDGGDVAGIKSIHEGELDPRAVVMFCYGGDRRRARPPVSRCVIPAVTYDDFIELWSNASPGSFVNPWELAELWIEQRRKTSIKASHSYQQSDLFC